MDKGKILAPLEPWSPSRLPWFCARSRSGAAPRIPIGAVKAQHMIRVCPHPAGYSRGHFRVPHNSPEA